ncbi:MAG: hypothetical protein K9G09_05655 [Pontimonas sp.]|nr:hypothetical protein [Pontimonas sp.]
MADCLVCGGKTSGRKEVCDSCNRQRIADELAARDAAILAERQARDERVLADRAKAEAGAKAWQQSFLSSISGGKPAFAYKTVYVPIDSVINDDTINGFNIAEVQQLGLAGWRVITVMPRTIGIGLTNMSVGSSVGETWGAGIGGNVAGVYVLLALEVSQSDPESIQTAVEIGEKLIHKGIEL